MKYHLIGIGGTGMGALAGLLKASGHEVRGSDSAVYPPMSEQLENLGIPVFEGFRTENLAWGPDAVVVGNVCTAEHIEVREAQRLELPLRSLPSTLGEELLATRRSLVVAGTHGKTTTSSLLAYILIIAGRDPSCFIGGVPLDLGTGFRLGTGEDFVIEGDEYDSAFFDKGSKFFHYRPQAAILTSVELDHVDIFSTLAAVRAAFDRFIGLIPADGLLVVSADEAEARAASDRAARCRVETYAVLHDDAARDDPSGETTVDGASPVSAIGPSHPPPIATWEVASVEYLKSGRCRFELRRSGETYDVYETILTGAHNLGNAAAAVAIAHSLGVAKEPIREGMMTFAGVARRQQFRGVAQGVYVLDDYAHHPTAVARTLLGLRRRFRGRRVVALYEPRSATSRRNTFQHEFVDAFAHADAVVIGPMHDPSRIPVAERFDPERLARDLHQNGTPATHISKIDDIVRHTVELVRPGDVVAVFSSGAFGGIHERLLAELGDAVIPARPRDMDDVRELLKSLELDWADLRDEDSRNFLVLTNEDGFIGCIGIEVFGEDAVLRSLAVKRSARGHGYGWMLADTAINQTRRRGVKRLYLMTDKIASDFFAEKHGFRVVDQSLVAPRALQSPTFTTSGQRGKNSIAMRLDL
ncbi:MAG TPA: GNAT family N-acetyltransferase [Kofleriaceae bacterium]|nr:GNAT family N-acetyltransferase [Kofleriaceae bacterium]